MRARGSLVRKRVNPAKLWDINAALESVKGDRGLLQIVMEAYLEESPRLLERMSHGIERADCSDLNLAAHALKGSLRFLGAERGFQLAYQLELMGRDQQLEQAGHTLRLLNEFLARLTPALRTWLAQSCDG